MKTKKREQNEKEFIDLYNQLPDEIADQIFRFMNAIVKKKAETKQADPSLRFYTLTDLEPIFSVTHRTLLTWVKTGYLPVSKIGGKWRISEKDLMRFLQEKHLDNLDSINQ